MKCFSRGMLVGAALLPLVMAFAPSRAIAQGGQPVKIGVVLSLSGPAAVFGLPERNAIMAIEKEIAAAGGVKGRKLELVFFDDKTNPTEAARGVTQLINDEKVVAIIGPGTGGTILAAGPIAERLKVPLLGPAGTVAVTAKTNSFAPWVFRVAINDMVGVQTLLQSAVKKGAKRIGIIYQEDAYGKFGAEYAQKLSAEHGFTVAETVSAAYTATDLTSQATRLRNANVDAVFIQMSISSLGAAFLKAANDVGLKVPFFANSGLAQKSFIDAAGSLGEGVHVLSIGNLPYDPTPAEQKLVALLRKNGNEPQGWGEIIGGNGLMTVVAALKAIDGPVTGEKMRDTIEGLCGFETYSMGKPCFSKDNHDGWGADALVVTTIRGGQFRSAP
ncbi:ABC transporter substrate-binding protein [Bradyrhizobium lablabi]|uniref:ABC transporter substrate-binding protein n=1 Tax=Bradyrhizobium lablabi TaxID=722472 RepID=UPI001BAA241D|nr:ABC transporter substrate-binding protein [Bradyrhizobium lablabi]MBR1125685.1 ABC transporter substrate-binding protein [Bradyrhizobium lablabi]